MAHVFDGKLYFTRDHMQGNLIPKTLKLPQPKSAPQPRASYARVQATVGVGTVLIWDFGVAYTRGGGYVETLVVDRGKCSKRTAWEAEVRTSGPNLS